MFNKFVTKFSYCHLATHMARLLKYKYQLNIIKILLIWGSACTCIVKNTTRQLLNTSDTEQVSLYL